VSKSAAPPPVEAVAAEPALPITTHPGLAIESGRSLWIGYGCAALGAALFSTKAIFIKLAYAEGIGTETLLALRMILSLPAYGIVGWLAIRDRRRSGKPLPDRGLVARAAAVGILGYWFASYADFLGLVYISAQFERLILFTYPAFVVLFGALFFAQRVRLNTLFGIAISYAGLALIFTADFSALGAHAARGAAWVLAAAIAFALYQLLAKGLIGRIGPRLFTCIAMSAAAFAALLQFALVEPLSSLAVGPKLLLYGLLLAIAATVLPSFLLNAALQRISAQANATIGTLSPVVTIVLAVAILGEPFGWVEAAGTALVLAGVGWFTLADRRR
jgi:drug/metabolite transporter (DMT)-like permease